MNKYSGSDFDDFLQEDGILEEVTARAQFVISTALARAGLQDALASGSLTI